MVHRSSNDSGAAATGPSDAVERRGVVARLGARFANLSQVGRFGIVGAGAVVVDVAVSNLLFFGVGWGPIAAKSVALLVATTLAFLGHRRWTFTRSRHDGSLASEYVRYWVVNLIGLGANLVVIRLGELVVQLNQVVAFNVVANGIGVVVAAVIRYVLYLKWVFPEGEPVVPGPPSS